MRKPMESKFTIELRYLIDDPNFEIFDFPYDFYDEDLKPVFEELFCQHYQYNEICCETVGRWKRMLQAHLNLNMSYWRQLYETELACKNINFLLNKDLKETFIRDIVENNNELEGVTGSNKSVNNITGDDTINFSESALDNGIADIYDTDKYTTVNKTHSNNNAVSNNKEDITSDRNKKSDNNLKEKTELISQGNIGITSSGQLLEDWRRVLINLNEIIIESCYDLFMLIY